MNLNCVIFGILFIVCGSWIAFFKGYSHIPAWKAMSYEQKKQVNIKPLSRNVGMIIILSGVIFLTRGFVSDFSGKWFVGAMITWLILAGLDVRFISKSDRYKKQ